MKAILFLLSLFSVVSHLQAQKVESYTDNKESFIDSMSYVHPEYTFEHDKPIEGLYLVRTSGAFNHWTRYGVMDIEGNIVIPLQYHRLYPSRYGLIVAKNEKGKWGILNKNHDVVVPFVYRGFGIINSSWVEAQSDKGNILITHSGEVLPIKPFDFIVPNTNELSILAFKRQRKYGLMDTSGRVLIEPMYDYLKAVDENFIKVRQLVNEKPKYGNIDTLNNIVVPIEYDEQGHFFGGKTTVRKAETVLLINQEGQFIKKLPYDEVLFFTQKGFAISLKKGKKGVVNRSLEEITKPKYDRIGVMGLFEENGLTSIELDGKIGFLDTLGREVIAPYYSKDSVWNYLPYPFKNAPNLATIVLKNEDGKGGKHILIDVQTQEELLIADEIRKLSQNLLSIKRANKYSIFHIPSGKEFLKTYDRIEYNYADFKRIIVKSGQKYGFIDYYSGEEVLPLKYDDIHNFSNPNLALVKQGNKYGLINRNTLELHLPLEYDYIDAIMIPSNVIHYLAKKGDTYGFISRRGDVAILFEYEKAYPFENGYAPVKKNGKWGVVDAQNNLVIPLIYDKLERSYCKSKPEERPVFEASLGGKVYYVNANNDKLSDCR